VQGTSVLNFIGDNGPVNYEHVTAATYLVSSDQLNVTKYFPETFGQGGNKPICKGCDFLQWGAWGTRVKFSDSEGPQYIDNIHLGWWVAGDVIDNSDLPTDLSASYTGHVIGNVSTNIGNNGWQTYVATGDLEMAWDFNSRSGDLTISKFDRSITPGGLTFSGEMSAPGEFATGKNQFGGPLSLANTNLPNNLSSLNGMTGSATGSFVRGPSNFNNNGTPISGSTPQGVIGNWNVGSARYNANGIFAGSIKDN
jgi:trimeric autotransporter adhesin